jgi:hypothetical protein
MATTPNMGLVVPDDHTDTDTWGLALNAAFGVSGGGIDAHDHSTGKGVQVPSAGIGINADLSFAAFALTTAKAITFSPVASASVATYTNALFVDSAFNLYFRNSSGTNVQITAGNTINVSLVGGIGGDYAAVSALLSYVDASRDYLFQQEGSPRPWAGIETGDIHLYEKAASISNAVTLKSPSALASAYTVTWPAVLPANTQPVTMTPAGVLNTGQAFALQTDQSITISGTASYKHGSKTLVVPVIASLISCSAGSASTTGGVAGAILAANTIGYIALPQISQHQRIVGVEAWFAAATDATACTCTIYTTSNANPPGTTFTTTGTALSTISTAKASVTSLTLQPTNGRTYWLQVGNDASPRTIVAVGVTYDVP